MRRWGCRAGWIVCGAWVSACVLNPAFDPLEEGEVGATTTAPDDPDPDTDAGTDSGTTSDTETTPDPSAPLGDPCPPLDPVEGPTIEVTPDQAAQLQSIVAGAEPGTTIVFQPGTYPLTDGLWITTPDLTFRSATGVPQDVVLDGGGQPEAMFSPRAARITVAELTIHRAAEHAVHVSGSSTDPAPGFFGYRLVMTDNGSSAFKVNPSESDFPADDGTLACSQISVSVEAREQFVDAQTCSNIGGFVGIASHGWHVRDNIVEGIWCPADYAGGAIRFIESSADPIVERNRIHDSVSGITLGVYEDAVPRRDYTGELCDGGFYDHYGGLVRNNVVTATGMGIASSDAGLDSGIALWQVCGPTVVHNTVVSAVPTFSSVEYRFSRTQATVVNNLVSHQILDRDDAGVPVAGNLQDVELSNFVDPLGGDVHLVPGSSAIDAGIMLGENSVSHDIDGDPRGTGVPDVGADEFIEQ